jgi:tRNA(fMet)-specific endonuclease VapC
VLVAAERDRDSLDRVISDDADVAIAAVTAADLLVGVELSGARTRPRRARFVESVLSLVPVEFYGLDVARAHARLLAHVRRTGRPRGAHDLIIAATAVTSDRQVVSADPAGFEDLPGVAVVSPSA